MRDLNSLKVKIFADGSDKTQMIEMYNKPFIKGLTTNPTLMKEAGIIDYERFARDILQTITSKSISFEVLSDDLVVMKRQAFKIAAWGNNVYVKIPITNTKNESTCSLVKELSDKGVKLNITAIMTLKQVYEVVSCLNSEVPSYISVFAGRIADTGIDPTSLIAASVEIAKLKSKAEIIWASPRELLNIFQAESIGCQIITVTNDILKKIGLIGYDLEKYSLDTVKMFFNDAAEAGYKL